MLEEMGMTRQLKFHGGGLEEKATRGGTKTGKYHPNGTERLCSGTVKEVTGRP